MTTATKLATLTKLVNEMGFEISERGGWFIVVKRDDSKSVFNLNILCRKAEQIEAGYTFTGCRVINRRREGRAVFEQTDPATWTGIRFEC